MDGRQHLVAVSNRIRDSTRKLRSSRGFSTRWGDSTGARVSIRGVQHLWSTAPES